MSISSAPHPPSDDERPSLQAAAQLAAIVLEQKDSMLHPLAAAALRSALRAERTVPAIPGPLISRVIYRSHSLLSDEGQRELLGQCQRNNAALNITGVLIHCHNEFMQVLEGPISPVSMLAEKIYKDPRHREFALLKTEIDVPRLFGSWSMASMEIDAGYFHMLVEHLTRRDTDVTNVLRDFVGEDVSKVCRLVA